VLNLGASRKRKNLPLIKPHPASFLVDPLLVKERVRKETKKRTLLTKCCFLF